MAIPDRAEDAVNKGLEVFAAGDAQAALALFQAALKKPLTDDEARAAHYNSACAQVKLARWEDAAQSVRRAVDDYDLKLSVALRDKDLAPLRERTEWANMVITLKKGGVERKQLTEMRAEARAPFRFPRLVIFGSLLTGATAGLLIILARLAGALQGGEGAPDLQETLTNLGINVTAVVVLGALVANDLRGKSAAEEKVSREEDLGALEVVIGSKTVLLQSLRLTARPVVIYGSQGQVSRSVRAAEPYKEELMARGVCLVPVVTETMAEDELDEADRKLAALRREFGAGKSEESNAVGFAREEPRKEGGAPGKKRADRWKVEARDPQEWVRWLRSQPEAVGLQQDDTVWLQVQLDGSIRKSGKGVPTWDKFVADLPEKDSLRTRLMDGTGV